MTSPTFYKFLRNALIAAALVFMPMYAFADYYVATTGSDSNSGTQAAPFKTILKASQVVSPGNTIHVAPGTYTGGFVTTVSGTASARIRYVSDTKWGAKIIPTSSSDYVWRNDGGYSDIIGFEITGLGITNIARLGIYLTGGNSSVQNSLVHNIADTVACTGNGGAGIVADQARGTAFGNYDFLGNVVHHIGFPGCLWIQGLYHSSTGNIKNNIAYAVGGFGIHLWHDDHNVNVVNNTVFGSGYGYVAGGGDQYNYFTGADYVNFVNNIAFDNTSYGFDMEGTLGTHNVLSNNLSFQNGTNWRLNAGTHINDAPAADPQFVNYIRTGGGDYHLKSTSPAIDRGTSSYSPPSTDLDGKVRPQGAGYDVGAYEYGTGGTTPPPPPPPSGAPALSLSPTSLNFGSVTVGTASAPQALTLTNSGTANLSFTTAFAFTGDFNGNGNCSTATALVPGASCVLNVTFTPTVSGARTGTITITTNAAGSPRVVQLSGGTTVTPPPPPPPPPPTGVTTLTNGTVLTSLSGATGATHMYSLTVPSGATNLRFVTSGGSGDMDIYAKFGSQPTSIAGGYDAKSDGATTAETISIPTPQAGTYYLLTNGWAAYSGVSLVGAYNPPVTTVSGPVVSLSPTSLSFGSVTVGTASAARAITITNTGTTNLSMTAAFAFTGDFTGSGNCSTATALVPGASCVLNITFTPTVSGTRTGSVTITTNAASSPNVVQLSGTGGTVMITPPPPPPPPGGTTYTAAHHLYVATTGSDSNAGTQSAPFQTILKASQVAVPDTIIHVAPGTYNIGTAGFTTGASGTASGHIRYLSDTKWGAKIVGSGTEIVWTNIGNYIEVIGFDIRTSGRLGFYSEGSYGSIYNCFVHDVTQSGGASGNGGAGIDVLGTDWVVHDNVVRNIDAAGISGTSQTHGIYIAGANDYVYNNIVSGIAAYGIQQWHGATHSIIVNNTVFNTNGGILIGAGDGGVLPSGSQNNYVANNISANNRNYGIIEYGVTSQNTYRNNLLYNNPSNTVLIGSGNVISGTITTNPLFVNYQANGTGDYHVQSTSPAINAGLSASAPATDMDGVARPQGAGYDIGAYEYGTGGTTPPPPPPPPGTAPILSLSPTSLNFGSVAVGTVSAPQAFTLTNTGSADLSFTTAFTFTGDFNGNGTCSTATALIPGASCVLNVTFTPTVSGTRTGTVTVATNAAGSPRVVQLSGGTTVTPPPPPPPPPTGVTTLSNGTVLTSLSGATGATHMYSLTVPSGASNLRFVSSGGTGDLDLYAKFGSQPTSVAGGYDAKSDGATTAETISIAAPQAGTYYLLTNGWAAYSGVSLVGAYNPPVTTVSGPVVSLSPTSLSFGSVVVGTASAARAITITNTGTTNLSMTTAFAFTGDFNGSGNCSTATALVPGASCVLNVTFTPTVSGTRTGSVTIITNAASSPNVVQLTGTGGGTTAVACGIPQDRINAAASGSTLDLTGCTYSGTIVVSKPLRIVGLTLNSPAGATAVTVNANDVTLDHMTIHGPQATTYNGSENGVDTAAGIARLSILGGTISRFGGICVRAYKVTDLTVSTATVQDCVYAGIMGLSLVRGSVSANTVSRIGVYGSAANGNNAYGITMSQQNPLTDAHSADTVVSDNVVDGVPTWSGLDTHAGQRIHFLRNTVRGTYRGIFVTGDANGGRSTDVVTDSNRVEAPGAAATQWGRAINYVYSTGGSLTNNTIVGWPAGYEIGTSCCGDPAATAVNLTTSGNIIQ